MGRTGNLAVLGAGTVLLVIGFLVVSGGLFRSGEDGASSLERHYGHGKIAFLVDGNLFVQELPDGRPVQLTEGNNAIAASWGASGEWLFLLWRGPEGPTLVTDLDGRRQRGILALMRSLSPQEDLMVGSRLVQRGQPDHSSLWLEHADGARSREVVPIFDGASVHWRPDGLWLAYEQLNAEQAGLIKVVSINGGDERDVDLAIGDDYSPENLRVFGWSPEGDHLIIGMQQGNRDTTATGQLVRVVSMEGELIAEVTTDGEWLSQSIRHSPDGTVLAVAEGDGSEAAAWRALRLAVFEPLTGQLTYISDPGLNADVPDWSPGGEQLVFAASPAVRHAEAHSEAAIAALSQRRLWIIGRDGSGQRQITNDPRYHDSQPRWTADGEHILFTRVDLQADEPSISLWLLNLPTGELRNLVSGLSPSGGPFPPGWRPGPALPKVYDYWPVCAPRPPC